jgi:DNA-binding NarL/FixJ family response regulator
MFQQEQQMPAKKQRVDPPKIVIVEDHPVMREGLASWFSRTGRWEVAGTAASVAEAKKLLTQVRADVALIDIQLEDGWGLDIIPWLKNEYTHAYTQSHTPVLAVYSAFDDYAHVNAAVSMGVRAYVCKRRGEAELETALFKALYGKTCIDEAAQTKLETVNNFFRLLTMREAEILSLVKDDLSNKQIAARLGISHRTVENVLSCIYDKTGITSRLELQKL